MWFDLSWCFGSPLVCCLRVVLDLFVYCVGVFVVLLFVSVLDCAGSVWLCVFDLVLVNNVGSHFLCILVGFRLVVRCVCLCWLMFVGFAIFLFGCLYLCLLIGWLTG